MDVQIPEIASPLGKGWSQPQRSEITFYHDKAYLTKRNFDRLKDYSRSLPTGVYPGKMWRAFEKRSGWHLCWYDEVCRVASAPLVVADGEEVSRGQTAELEEKPVKIVGRGNLGRLDPAYVGDVEAHLEHNPREASRLGVSSPGDLTPDQFLDCFLEWNGIVGYGPMMRRLMTQLGWTPPQEVLAGPTEDPR